MKKITSYTLDVAKWVCGYPQFEEQRLPDTFLGEGSTCFLNKQGKMCCLGQFAEQALGSSEVFDGLAGPFGYPSTLAHHLDKVYDPNFVDVGIRKYTGNPEYRSNQLARDCVDINDNMYTTIDQKIDALRRRLAEDGIELIVINRDKV